MGKFQHIIDQINAFIRKYYKNEMIKGTLLFLVVLFSSYLLVSGLEYLGRFDSSIRLILLLSFILVNGYLFIRYLLIPMLKLNKLSKSIGIWEASDMIGKFFPEIGDKLKNTLQLERDSKNFFGNLELLKASIEQRSEKLSVVPFTQAVDLKENRRFLKYFLPVVFAFILIAVFNPAWVFDSSKRVINFNDEFVIPAPFSYRLMSSQQVVEGENYEVIIGLSGEDFPGELKLVSNVGTYNLMKVSNSEFRYEFNNVRQDLIFYCEGNGFKSSEYHVNVLSVPVVEEIKLKVKYPRHTGLSDSEFDNVGSLSVPEGSRVDWFLNAKNLSNVDVLFQDTVLKLASPASGSYNFSRSFLASENYNLVLSSEEVKNADTLAYSIAVIADEYPQIAVNERIDTLNSLIRYFEGNVSDDYGFRGLSAQVKVFHKDTSYVVKQALKINPKSTSQLFSFFIDLSVFELKPGSKIEYNFVVTDNDEINGFKTTSSGKKVYQVPSLDEVENNLSASADEMKKEMDDLLKEAEELKKEISDLKNELMNKPNLDWKDKQRMENLLNMQKELTNKIENLQNKYELNSNERENLLEENAELQEKREQLQKLMEELMDEELLSLFEELEKLMNEMNKEDLIQQLDQLENKSENLSEELDRTLELFKMMEIDQKLNDLESQLRELAEMQDELKEMSSDKSISKEELAAKQDSLNKKFDEIQKDMDEIEQKNQELKNPMSIDFNEEMENSIDNQMNESKEELENNDRKDAQESQSKTSEMMKQMADDVSAMQMQNQQQQQSEDMDALRYLLENIVALSKMQENLMNEMKVTNVTDPYYGELVQKQIEIQAAHQIVNDSLVALSQRVFQLSSFITEELADLNFNLDNSLTSSEERKTVEANQSQQYVMTGYNDLALMLAEVLNQMQEQMKSQMQGNGSCSKPGGTGQGSGKMSMQQMKDALQNQINQMKNGSQPGGKDGKSTSGQGGGQNPGSIPGLSNEQIAKMAAQQQQIRESLKEMREELNEDGSGAGNGLNELIEEIDQLERDLLNGNIDENFVKRQEDILMRLLEHEKAQRERGYSEERESKEGKNSDNGNLIEFAEYNRKKNAEAEFLRSLPLSLQVYYKTLVNEYFNTVNN